MISLLLWGGESSITCGRIVLVAKRPGGETSKWRNVLLPQFGLLDHRFPEFNRSRLITGSHTADSAKQPKYYYAEQYINL